MTPDLRWLPGPNAQRLQEEGTDAFRLAEGAGGWIERFGETALISCFDNGLPRAALPEISRQFLHLTGLHPAAVYARRLVKGPARDDAPRLVSGQPASPRFIVSEHRLRFAVDFSAGYSCGLFLDQRANRQLLRSLGPRSVLNCFAFTCAFSVAAAAEGASTLSVDLAKASLQKGRENFSLNSLPPDGHRFIADDVFDVLPRLARRGERFDAIILDPPTFSRGRAGRVFRAEDHFRDLLTLALPCAAPAANILLSTNCSRLSPFLLRALAKAVCPPGARFRPGPSQPDFPSNSGASTLWIGLPP